MDNGELEIALDRIKKLEERADQAFNDLLEMAGKVLTADLENARLRTMIADLVADVPKSPPECYQCGSCDVVSQWYHPAIAKSPGFSWQQSRVIVWYCVKHEPKN